MARKCACEKLLDLVEQDPRFVLAGPAASMVFLRLVRMMARIGDTQVLRLGFLFGSWSELAFGLRITETELETQLQTLAARGVIERDDTSITLPEWLGLRDRRAEAARANGTKGGRPRKYSPVPGQGSMLLPIAGTGGSDAAAKTQETKIETQSETLSRARPLSPENQSTERREESGVSVLLSELIQIGGLDPEQRHSPAVIEGWLAAGATPDHLREAFRTVAARPNPPRRPPLTYFTGAVEDVVAKACGIPRRPPTAAPDAAGEAQDDPAAVARGMEWQAIMNRWSNDGCPGSIRPPSRQAWARDEVPDRDLWLEYPTKGAAVFRKVA